MERELIKILLLTDFSKNSKKMIEYAIGFFGFEGVEYTLFNAYSEPEPSRGLLVSVHDLLSREAEKSIKEERKRLDSKFRNPKLNIICESIEGGVVNSIQKLHKKHDYDFICVGKKGRSRLKSALFGSTSLDVMKRIEIPLIIVPEKSVFKIPLKFGFATDLKSLSDYSVLKPMIKVLKRSLSDELEIVNVQEDDSLISVQEASEGVKINRMLESVPHHFFNKIDEDVESGLISFVRNHNIDMLVMVAKKHGLVYRLFSKSVTKQMTFDSDVPLLILKES